MEGCGALLLSCLSLLISCLFYHSLSHKTNNTEHVCYENEPLSPPLSVALLCFHFLSPSLTKLLSFFIFYFFCLCPLLLPYSLFSCSHLLFLLPGCCRLTVNGLVCSSSTVCCAAVELIVNFSHVHAFSFSPALPLTELKVLDV